jgi:zinc protease
MRTTLKTLALALVAVCGLSVSAKAQVPADVSEFTTNGIHVILRSSKANDVVAVYLGVEGGLAYGETANPVLSGLTAGLISESGSDKYPKESFRDTLAKLSTSIAGGGSLYNMSFSLRTVRPNWNAAWGIFEDLLLHPHFDATEYQKQSQLAINGIQSRASNPEGYTDYVSDSIWFGKSPLNRAAEVADVSGLSTQKLQDFYLTQFQRSRMLLVVVGNITRVDLERKLSFLGPIPQGTFKSGGVDHVTPADRSTAYVMTRELPTTYFVAKFSAPTIGSKDWWAERTLFQVLDKRLFDEVRTKRNLSYAPGGYVTGTRGNMFGVITLQSVLPDSAASVVMNEIHKLQTEPIPTQELENAKAARITTFFYVRGTSITIN